jgi:protein TonB
MITRALSSATTSLAITMGLLFAMHLLIATGENVVVEPRARHMLDLVSVVAEDDPEVETPALPKIDRPRVPPPTRWSESATSGAVGVGLPAASPPPRTYRPTLAGTGKSDGPLVNIIRVQPRYPVAAQTRGLEGTVIVQFDVSPSGTVENAVVVESSNGIFNKAAIEATYRFRYRPRIVDGTGYPVRGLQQLFRFDLED